MKQKISNDNIFMDQPSGELTFGKIFKVLKCSLLRAVVYLLVACIVASSIALIITVSSKADASISATIKYNHDGVDKGNGPNNKPFSTDRINSTNVLTNAINNCGFDIDAANLAPYIHMDKIIPPEIYAKIEDLKAQANTDKNVNEQLSNLVYYPKMYKLVFDSYDKFGLNETQATTLLDNVIKEYKKDWYNQYYDISAIPTALFEKILDGTGDIEYISYPDLFDTHIAQLSRSINKYKDSKYISKQTVVENGVEKINTVSFSSLMTDIELLQKEIDSFVSFVESNHVYREIEAATIDLQKKLQDYDDELSQLEHEKELIIEQILAMKDDHPSDVTIITRPDGSTETVHKYPTIYNDLQTARKEKDSLIALNTKLRDQTKRQLDDIKKIQNGNLDVPSFKPEGNEAYANQLLVNISNNFLSIVDKSQKFVEDFKENGIITEDISVTTPIARSNVSSVSNKLVLVIFLLAGVVAVVAAISVTVVKQKAFAFTKAQEKNSEVAPETAPEAETETTEEVIEDKVEDEEK